MKKLKILVIVILMIIPIVYSNSNNNKTFIVNGIKYKTTLNGNSVSSFPASGNYEVTIECENAIGKWNYSKWVAEIYKITGNVSCDVSFTSTTATNLNDYIVSLAGTTHITGQVVSENGYRYEGKEPNNYISFNNEIWRIIGVFDESSHGVSNTNLVKIIREDSIGGYGWSTSNSKNDWTNTDLIILLNNYYFKATDATSSDYCGDVVNCDYTVIGIQPNYRNMVQEVTWYLGGVNTATFTSTVSDFYTKERSSSVVYGNSTSVLGNVGLMYASDYGYSIPFLSCARSIDVGAYNTNDCAGNSWLFTNGNERTITHNSVSEYYSWNIMYNGSMGYDNTDYNLSIRPVVYLKSNVMILSGDGSVTNPYQIRLES